MTRVTYVLLFKSEYSATFPNGLTDHANVSNAWNFNKSATWKEKKQPTNQTKNKKWSILKEGDKNVRAI